MTQIGHVLVIALLASMNSCGSSDAKLASNDQNRRGTAEDLFEKRRQVDKLYLTEKTHRKVIRPGDVLVPFVNEDTAELCWPALICTNPECPGEGDGEFPYLFVHNDPLVTVRSNGEPVYPEVSPGQDYAQMVADAGGFPDATCPACYEAFRQGKTETQEEKNRYANYVKEYILPDSAERQRELQWEAQALMTSKKPAGAAGQSQNVTEEELKEWERTATDESAPLEDREDALGELAEYAAEASQIEVRPWGTARKGLIDEKSAKIFRRLATDAKQEEIRVQAVEALGKLKDIDGIEEILGAMEDESLLVRKAAAGAVKNVLSSDFRFRADDPPEQRAAAVAHARKFLKALNPRFIDGLRDPAVLEQWKREAGELNRREG